jgi:transglutaminase-like putative cysteine protease
MRFGLIHRIMTDALAVLGILAVVSTASLSPWTNALLILGLAASLAVPENWQGRPALKHFATFAPLALFFIQAARLLAGRPPLDVAVEFAALLQIVRLATRRGAAHDQQIIVLALLHFIAGTVLGGGLTYGLCFLGYLVVAPGALVLSHLRREVEGNYRQGARDRTGLPVDVPRILRSRRVVGRGFLGATCLLSVPILLFTITLFVLFPRVGLSLLLLSHPRTGRMIGFSEHVDLGDVGVLRDDPTIALRFEVRDLVDPPPPRMTIRLRGTSFDTYDGHAWSRTLEGVKTPERSGDWIEAIDLVRPPNPAHDHVLSVDLEPIDPPVVFVPERAVSLRIRQPNALLLGETLTVRRAPDGELRYAGPEGRGLRYDAYVPRGHEVFSEPLSVQDRARYLAPPPDLSEQAVMLAHQLTDDKPTADGKASAIENYLRHSFAYDLHSSSSGKPHPVDDFLFESRRGHCEFFSTAMAVMLRAIGIPSRNVTGFVGGTWNRFGHYYAVRQGDAHSWVEAYIEAPGQHAWRTYDPTPTSGAQPLEPQTGAYYYVRDLVEALSQRWNTYVVGYDLHKQVRLLDDVRRQVRRLRRKGGDGGMLPGPLAHGPAIALGLASCCALLYAWWRRRQRPSSKGAGPQGRAAHGKPDAVVALYRALESALANLGVNRLPSVPPLRHARELEASHHPLAGEVLSLTHVYLETRFGGIPLTEAALHDFERRVQEIRKARRHPSPT